MSTIRVQVHPAADLGGGGQGWSRRSGSGAHRVIAALGSHSATAVTVVHRRSWVRRESRQRGAQISQRILFPIDNSQPASTVRSAQRTVLLK